MQKLILGTLFLSVGWIANTSAAEPVRAPTCQTYIERGQWIYRFNEWTLEIVPTECGREIGAEETAYMFFELVKKFSGNQHWKNTRGMINQLTCHYAIARTKAEWNLDPWRPYVGHAATVAAQCNVTVPKPDEPFE
ncbi:DUF2599 domain-containing protein [Pseudomonas caspiana]|uniref:DUF2599 domain-containing protein n=1 Tax=Pseudomonas caspiana TaxID=1451454 RepID=UPI0032EC3F47